MTSILDFIIEYLLMPLIGIGFTIIAAFIKLYIQNRKPSYDLGKYIKKNLFSAELDLKTKQPTNTYYQVKFSYKKILNKVKIHVVRDSKDADTNKAGWVVTGKLINDTLVGEWYTFVKGTKRYGAAFLKFLDNGRAIGYWIGYSGSDTSPKYGYWIIDPDIDKLKTMSEMVLNEYEFKFYNVGLIVEFFERKDSIPIKSIIY